MIAVRPFGVPLPDQAEVQRMDERGGLKRTVGFAKGEGMVHGDGTPY